MLTFVMAAVSKQLVHYFKFWLLVYVLPLHYVPQLIQQHLLLLQFLLLPSHIQSSCGNTSSLAKLLQFDGLKFHKQQQYFLITYIKQMTHYVSLLLQSLLQTQIHFSLNLVSTSKYVSWNQVDWILKYGCSSKVGFVCVSSVHSIRLDIK